MRIDRSWIRSGCIAVASFLALVPFLRVESGVGIPLPAPWDKVAHFFYFGTMALLFAHGLGRRWLVIPLLAVPLVGLLDEWHQAGIPGRDASLLDWLADVLGMAAFLFAYWKISGRARQSR